MKLTPVESWDETSRRYLDIAFPYDDCTVNSFVPFLVGAEDLRGYYLDD